jgi:hypothetical protein
VLHIHQIQIVLLEICNFVAVIFLGFLAVKVEKEFESKVSREFLFFSFFEFEFPLELSFKQILFLLEKKLCIVLRKLLLSGKRFWVKDKLHFVLFLLKIFLLAFNNIKKYFATIATKVLNLFCS